MSKIKNATFLMTNFVIYLCVGACFAKGDVWIVNIWSSHGFVEMVPFEISRQILAISGQSNPW